MDHKMPGKDILFSIIVPCYNQARYIADMLESITAQTHTNWECILVDDGSTDDSVAVVQEWMRNDKRIKLYSKSNGGAASARNSGIEKAGGEFLLFLDPDDIIYPEYLFKAAQLLEKKKYDLLICGFQTLNNDLSEVIMRGQPFVNGRNFFEQLSGAPVAPIHCHVVSKELVNKIGFFDPELRSNEDWDFWIRVGKATVLVGTLNYTGAGYRMVPKSLSRNAETFLKTSIEVARRIRNLDDRLDTRQNVLLEPVEPVIIKYLLMSCGTLVIDDKVEEACRMLESTVERYQLQPSLNDYSHLLSYLTFTDGYNNKAKRDFYTRHVGALSEFLAFCEESLEEEGLFANALAYLTIYCLQPQDLSAIIPYIRTKTIVYKGAKSLFIKALGKVVPN